MSRLLNGAMLASCFCGLILLAASDARAGETLTGDSGINQFSGALEVGVNTSGSYIVDGGTVVDLEDSLLIASNPGSSGVVTVTGPGTALSLGSDAGGVSLMAGRQGTGEMTISGGAVVDSSGFSSVGSTAGAIGSLTLTGAGSRLVTMSAFSIGLATFIPGISPGPDFGTEGGHTIAALDILDGAILNSTNAAISNGPVLGNPTGLETTDATVSVSGSGSQWTLDQFLSISPGKNATGTLIVSNGGVVSAPQLDISAIVGFTCVGNLPSVGNLEVLSGASVQVDGFRVGWNGCLEGTPVTGTVSV